MGIQWRRLYTSNTGAAGSIPIRELRSHMLHSIAKTYGQKPPNHWRPRHGSQRIRKKANSGKDYHSDEVTVSQIFMAKVHPQAKLPPFLRNKINSLI